MTKSWVLDMLDMFCTPQPRYWLFDCAHTFAFFRKPYSWNNTLWNFLQFTCSLLSVCCDDNETLTKTNTERKEIIADYSPSLRETKAGAWSRNHKGMLLTSLLPTLCLPSFFFIPPRAQYLGMLLAIVGWALLYQLPIKKMTHWHAYIPVWSRQTLQLTLFPITLGYV